VAAAAVLLGLLPTTLAVLGSNSRETSLLALRRPFLALLLAIGAPAVSPLRSTQHADHAQILTQGEDRITIPSLTTFNAALVACAQYLFACASAFNVAHVTWQLCILTVNSFSPGAVFYPALWVATAVLVNIGGYLSTLLRTRVQMTSEPYEKVPRTALLPPGAGRPDVKSKKRTGAMAWLLREATPCVQHDQSRIQVRKESWKFIFISWLTSVGAMSNILLGTLSLSGALYISTGDAIVVIARFFGSAMLCRIILNFEMAGMRRTVDVFDEIVD
jgi:hypothetical protein